MILKDLTIAQEIQGKWSNWLCLASESNRAIVRSICFHNSGGKDPCHVNSNIYMIIFGATEIILSQIPIFGWLWWLSIVAAAMSFTYSTIGLGSSIGKVIGMNMIICSVFFLFPFLILV